jgi:hypothetical protein
MIICTDQFITFPNKFFHEKHRQTARGIKPSALGVAIHRMQTLNERRIWGTARGLGPEGGGQSRISYTQWCQLIEEFRYGYAS